jgi:hypothetical protein
MYFGSKFLAFQNRFFLVKLKFSVFFNYNL